MKKTLIIAFIVLLVVILFILGFMLFKKYQQKQVGLIEESEIECLKDVRIAQLETELHFVYQRLAECEEAKESSVKTPTASPRRTVPSPRPTTTPAPTPRREVISPSEQAPPDTRPGSPSKANLTHLRDINGQIIFCVMANNDGGMHFPQFALEKGVRFTAVQANPTRDGTNWIVEPLDEITGDYGLLSDGTFFVRHDVIDRVLRGQSSSLESLAIKTSFTSWQAKNMERIGDFWIIKLLPDM